MRRGLSGKGSDANTTVNIVGLRLKINHKTERE